MKRKRLIWPNRPAGSPRSFYLFLSRFRFLSLSLSHSFSPTTPPPPPPSPTNAYTTTNTTTIATTATTTHNYHENHHHYHCLRYFDLPLPAFLQTNEIRASPTAAQPSLSHRARVCEITGISNKLPLLYTIIMFGLQLCRLQYGNVICASHRYITLDFLTSKSVPDYK
jgi:hypothetical protein